MKKIVLGLLLAAFMGTTTRAFALRVAYVDIKKAFDGYSGTQVAKDKLKKEAEDEKAQLEGDQDLLKKKLDDLQAQKKALAPEKYEEREATVTGEVKDLQAKIQDVQSDLAAQEQKMTEEIVDQIREVVGEVADREKYDFVFEKSTLLYGGVEITASVITELNNKK
jgi:Skp family chaperone for outer membrane proteins